MTRFQYFDQQELGKTNAPTMSEYVRCQEITKLCDSLLLQQGNGLLCHCRIRRSKARSHLIFSLQ
jgi:hypothetical protein